MKCPYCIKQCKKCGRLLVANAMNFKRSKKGKWGLVSRCKKCDKKYNEEHKEHIKEYGKEYREKNKERIKEYRKEHSEDRKAYNKEYYYNNVEVEKEKRRQYKKEHKDKEKERYEKYYKEHKEDRKKYYENNKEKILEHRKKYYEENKEKILKQCKQYRKNNPHISFNNHIKRRCKEENQGSGISKDQWLEMMKFFDWKCAYSGEYLGGEDNKSIRTIDHIISLNNNGLNEIWNCVPMLRNYNSSKNDNDMVAWYKQQEFFSEERLNKIYEWQEYAFEKWGNK